MRIALGQFNAVVGDLAGNVEKMRDCYARALEGGARILVFPELAICGYPPEDLLHKSHFLHDNFSALERLACVCPDITMIVGFAESYGTDTYNSAAVLRGGAVGRIYRKSKLPNYGVFDESRYFESGDEPVVIDVGGFNIALTICRDIWDIEWLSGFLRKDERKVEVVVNISASPFHIGKTEKRKVVLGQCAKQFDSVVCYCNLVGGQDELVFDGRGMFVDPSGEVVSQAKAFEEDLLIAEIGRKGGKQIVVKPISDTSLEAIEEIEEIYRAIVLATADYAGKNGFGNVLLGLSGGIDSAVVTSIAVAALGAENVVAITMPSRFNSAETIADAGRISKNLGIKLLTIPIESTLKEFHASLGEIEGWDDKGTAYENLQARIRGCMLMSLSNQFGALVLTSGNKSETAVGYATLYGDTAGGFAVIKDVPKTTVYKLAEYINKINGRQVIPVEVIERAPSAELREDQKDSDSLASYDLLDEILKGYIEEDKSAGQLIESGLDRDVVLRVIGMVDRNEYKRRQSPPGVKITPKAFGKDRRLPITNHYRSAE